MNCQNLCQNGPVFSIQCKPGGVRRDLRAHYEELQNCYSGAFQRESLRIRKRALRPSKGSGGIRGGSGTESRRDDRASGEEGLHILLTFFQAQAFNSLINDSYAVQTSAFLDRKSVV